MTNKIQRIVKIKHPLYYDYWIEVEQVELDYFLSLDGKTAYRRFYNNEGIESWAVFDLTAILKCEF